MLEAAAWAGLAAMTLILGAWAGATFDASPRRVGLVMGFGAGALIASVSFELTADAFDRGGAVPLTLGLAVGALAFFVGDRYVDRLGGAHRKRISDDPRRPPTRTPRRRRCSWAPRSTRSPSR